MRYGSKGWDTYEPPAWTQIPGFDVSLQKLNLGTTLKYNIQPKEPTKRGFYISDTYQASVVKAERKSKQKQMLENKDPLFFCFNPECLGKEHTGHWFIRVPEGTLHDGSSVSIARFWTGSGISKTLAPAGLLHDFITRIHTATDGYIYTRPSLRSEPTKVRATIRDLAIIWGAAVESITLRPTWQVKLMENFLKLAHPIHLLATPEQLWRKVK